MAITFFGVASTPADNGTQAGPTATITPPASMQEGDFVIVFGQRRENTWPVTIDLDYTAWGGQRWSQCGDTDPAASGTPAALQVRAFWCRFNGTWSGSLTFRTSNGATDSASTLGMSLVMLVFRPTSSSKFWVPCIWPASANFVAGTTPFTKTITGITTVAQHGSNSHVSVAMWATADQNTWGSLAGAGWSQTGLSAQYRNLSGLDMSMAFAYQIQTASGATGNVSLNQATLGGDAGSTFIMAFTEIDLPAGGTGGTAAFVQSEIFGDNGGASSVAVTLASPVASGNSVVGHFNFEGHTAGAQAQPIFPITDNQGNELVVIQCIDYRELSQLMMTWYRPNITNAPTTFSIVLGVAVVTTGATAHEINGGVDLNGYSGTWGFPGFSVPWDPLSAGSVTTTAASYIYAASILPGQAFDPPVFNYTAWGGTKREEIGNDAPVLQTIGSGDLLQSAAGAIDVRDSSASSLATTLMMVALAPAAGGASTALVGMPGNRIYHTKPFGAGGLRQ